MENNTPKKRKRGQPRNLKMREKIKELRGKGLTFFEISKILGMSPQLAHYLSKDLDKVKDNVNNTNAC